MQKFVDKMKDILFKMKCFFVAVGRTANKTSQKVISPEIKPGLKRVSRMFGTVMGVFARILMVVLLTVLLTGAILGVFGAIYVTRYLDIDTNFDLSQVSLDLTSHIYAENPDASGNPVLLASLSREENRIWAAYDDIPQWIIDAVVAIEDERFWRHDGVDWKRTVGAFYNLFKPGSSQFGGSTITQQLIKNTTLDNDVTVARKLREIFRAMEFERRYPGVEGKQLILEYYLNTIYLGNGCNGVRTAAEEYFGKSLDELTLAECAALVGITNNPSVYNPYSRPKNTKKRQEVILGKMLELQLITQHEYNIAKYQPLVYARNVSTATTNSLRSWYVDQVIRDVVSDLSAEWGVSEEIANLHVYSGGLNIYACIDLDMQAAMDAIWADPSCWPDSPDAEPPEAAMMVVDQATGDIKAMIGGREKTGNLVYDLSTRANRPPGSAIKPITVYGPAFDLGLITPYSPIDDIPVRNTDGRGWPYNSPKRYDGHINILQGVTVSKNTVAVQVVEMVGVQRSFDYAVNRFGLSTLVESRMIGNKPYTDIEVSPLSMGSLTDGVTVRDLTGAYAALANNGVRNKTRTYTHITDPSGAVVYENALDPTIAVKAKTAYYMETCLVNAVKSGTGTGAQFKTVSMPIAGKTGTTSANKDRWFAGYTPYYTAVCWFGYTLGRDMSYYTSNPAVHMWRQVMEKAHEGLERKEFEQPAGLETFTYCIDSGLRVSDACRLDPRGDRSATGLLDKDDIPLQTCTMHTTVNLCTASGRLATPYCPEETLKKVSLLNLTRWAPVSGFALADEQYTLRTWQGGDTHAHDESEGGEDIVPAASTQPEGFYRIVAVGTDGKTPYNTFCELHTTPPVTPPETEDPGENGDEEDPADPSEGDLPPPPPDTTLPDASQPPENWWESIWD